MKKLIFLVYTLVGMLSASAQYRVLHNFGSIPYDGRSPQGSLTLSGKVLYGMTPYGGMYHCGCIFSIDTDGNNYKVLFNFDTIDGINPFGSLTVLGNKLYGMTAGGGLYTMGIVFSIDTNGNNYRDLFDFNGSDGKSPGYGALTISNRKMYGTTPNGGPGNSSGGVVFSVDTDGHNYKILEFYFNNNPAASSPMGSLTLSGEILYGLAWGGISGSIFSIDTNGNNYEDMHDFNPNSADGGAPFGSVVLSEGKLYGMTSTGGPLDVNGFGIIFSIDTSGNNYKDMLNFNVVDGEDPTGSFIINDGILYGMTVGGGKNHGGLIFSIDTNGTGDRDLYDFTSTGDGPHGNLTISGNTFYGMTGSGDADSAGVIFSFNYVTAGVSEVKGDNENVQVYPNPSNAVFQLEITNEKFEINNKIEVYNVLGQQVYQSNINSDNTEINLSNQPNGIYLYRVISETGEMIGEGKLVKQ